MMDTQGESLKHINQTVNLYELFVSIQNSRIEDYIAEFKNIVIAAQSMAAQARQKEPNIQLIIKILDEIAFVARKNAETVTPKQDKMLQDFIIRAEEAGYNNYGKY